MAKGDGGQFLGDHSLEFVEIASTCYHHPYASSPETTCQMDAWFSSYGKNKFLRYVFLYPVVKQCILQFFRTRRKMSCRSLRMMVGW